MPSAPLRAAPAPGGRDTQSDIGWRDICEPSAVAAAKLHVLQLEPIKEKLGPRWGRLSDLVHQLFEQALKRAQGPGDSFVSVGELSYVVTFRGLSPEEANLACAAVANEACKLLFGDGLHDISVRSLVGTVPLSAAHAAADWHKVSALLEQHGQEIVIRSGSRPDGDAPAQPAVAVKPQGLAQPDIALVPMWDLQSRKSSSVFLAPRTSLTPRGASTVRRFLGSATEGEIIGAEMALVKAAGDFARRVHDAQKVCAVGTSVSYLTLSSFNARIRYIGALKTVPTAAPFLLKIERIPEGTPLSRLGELIAMLGAPHLRILAEFDGAIPDLDIRLDAHGIGAALPDNCSAENAGAILQSVTRRVAPLKKFAFVTGLANAGLVGAAGQHHVRFGVGPALGGGVHLADLKDMPQFPLQAAPPA
jgi:hypothetical protein